MLLPALGLACLVSGCGLGEIQRQAQGAEDIGQISGRIEVRSGTRGPVHVMVATPGMAASEFIIVHDVIADPDGSFRLSAAPGTYFVGAFQDANRDEAFQREVEPAGYYRSEGLNPLPVTLTAAGRLQLGLLEITGPVRDVPELRTVDGALAATKNIGRVVSLSDPMFSEENASIGLWRPVDFLLQVGGGLFMLQDYRPGLIPVIFIHGINDTPVSFAPVIETLDKSRVQPWVLYYPSGMRLDVVSDYLDRAVDMLQARYGFASVYVVAHSMGGLVARSFVMKHEQRAHPAPVAFMMTINSPMLGLGSATRGVGYSPVVVPAWRDIAENSEFIVQLRDWKWPARIPYHLVFSYEPGSGSDGVVPLESQIPLGLQDESTRVYGFQGTHAGLLSNADFLRHFREVLAATGSRAASR